MTSREPAHRRLIADVIATVDTAAVSASYPHIAATYPEHILTRYSSDPPYYCHYMLWRLATLDSNCLNRLDALLRLAKSIPGWERECSSLVNDRAFEVYWSLLWQLQIAEFLDSQQFCLEWGGAGPDLIAARNGETLYVECLVPRKQYGKLLFIQELLDAIHPRLRVENQVFLRVAELPDDELNRVLAALVEQLAPAEALERLEAQTQQAWPVQIPVPKAPGNLSVYLDGTDLDAYQPGVEPSGGGNPTRYLNAMLEEALRGKSNANSLADHHPNVLAVNLLLGDLQLGNLIGQVSAPRLPESVDRLAWGTFGIDAHIERGAMRVFARDSGGPCDWAP